MLSKNIGKSIRKILFAGTLLTIFMVAIYLSMKFSPQLAICLTPSMNNDDRNTFIGQLGLIGTFGTLLQLAIQGAGYLIAAKVEQPHLGNEGLLNAAVKRAWDDFTNLTRAKTSQPRVSNVSAPTRILINKDTLKRINEIRNHGYPISTQTLLFRLSGVVLWLLSFSEASQKVYIYRASDIYLFVIYAVYLVALLMCLPLFFAVWRRRNDVDSFRSIVIDSLSTNSTIPGVVFSSRVINSRLELIRLCSSNVARVNEFWPACASLDNQTLDSRYTFLSVINWALPVIGFVGTAHGLSEAVVSFRTIFGQSNATINATIIGGSVIPALAASFTSTVSALLATVSTYVCISALKSADRDNLEEIDRTCLELLTAIEAPSIERELQAVSNELRAIAKTWTDVSAGVSTAEETTRRLKEATAVTDSVVQAMSVAAQSVDNANAQLATQAEEFRAVLTGSDVTADRLSKLTTELEKAAGVISRTASSVSMRPNITYQFDWNKR